MKILQYSYATYGLGQFSGTSPILMKFTPMKEGLTFIQNISQRERNLFDSFRALEDKLQSTFILGSNLNYCHNISIFEVASI